MADHLSSLPQSNEYASDSDMNVVHSVFGNTNPTEEGILSTKNLKRLLFLGIIFVVINLPVIDTAIKSVLPETSDLVFLFMKTLVFIVIIALGQFFQMA